MQIVEVLAYHGSNVSYDEPVDYKEKYGWRKVWNGGFEDCDAGWSRTTPVWRASEGKSKEGVEFLLSLGAAKESGLYIGSANSVAGHQTQR
jgi:hypothetical protein